LQREFFKLRVLFFAAALAISVIANCAYAAFRAFGAIIRLMISVVMMLVFLANFDNIVVVMVMPVDNIILVDNVMLVLDYMVVLDNFPVIAAVVFLPAAPMLMPVPAVALSFTTHLLFSSLSLIFLSFD
jgi:hypothetical protein